MADYGLAASTPPPPPPKQQSSSNTPQPRGPPLPPPPPGHELSELDGSQTYRPQSQHLQQQQGPPQPHSPPIEGHWLPEVLKDKSVTDLQDVLNTPSLQSALLGSPRTTHPAIPASEQHLTPLVLANIVATSQLMETEARLAALREQTQSRLLALRALEQQHRSKISETEAALRDFSPQALYQRLNASVQEQELLLRGIEESWLEEDGIASEREVTEFVRRAKDARKTAFMRRERKSRWDDGRVGGWR